MSYITNLYTDPSCHKQIPTWAGSGGVNVERLADGRYRYTHADNGPWSVLNLQEWLELMRWGRVVVVAYTATSGLNVEIESGTPLASGTTPSGATWKAAKTVEGGNRSIFCHGGGSLTLEALAVYEGDEWPTVQQLLPRFPWFDGGSMPLQ